jgi:hypothetical protein
MHPTLVAQPFHRDGWVYDEKYDGWRLVAHKTDGQVRLVSRNGLGHARRFAELAAAIAVLPATTLILNGEVGVFDEGAEACGSRDHGHASALHCAREPNAGDTPPAPHTGAFGGSSSKCHQERTLSYVGGRILLRLTHSPSSRILVAKSQLAGESNDGRGQRESRRVQTER